MKKMSDILNNENDLIIEYLEDKLILEYIIGFADKKNINSPVNLTDHGDEREGRKGQIYVDKNEILYSISKVILSIKEDLDENIIKFGDIIHIVDKSKDIDTNYICSILKDRKNKNGLKINIITIKRKYDYLLYDIVKTYTTYLSDNDVKYNIKLLKNVGI